MIKSISDGFSDVFVYNTKRALNDLLSEEHNYRIEKVYEWEKELEPIHTNKVRLWKLTKK
ncbi:MAG: hypothetical protein F6K10_17480 [Moorea sp. SIO2B7]|nr:hypothetical protein [Moorena sp. SIO2B7]